MRRIDRAVLKRTLGGEYPCGPRNSWTLLNEAESRAYFLGWNMWYRDYTYPLRTAAHYPLATVDAGAAAVPNAKSLDEWQKMLDRVLAGELEPCLVLQVPTDPTAETLQLARVLDGVFFGEVVENDGEIWLRAEDRVALRAARTPRLQSA